MKKLIELKYFISLKQNLSKLIALLKMLSKLKNIHTIATPKRDDLHSISVCILKDKRIVLDLFSDYSSIIVYDYSCKPQIYINHAHDNKITSFCVFRNGELISISSSDDKTAKVWRINQNDYILIHTISGYKYKLYRAIELKDGKICITSNDCIEIWDNKYKCVQTLYACQVITVIEMNNFIISVGDDQATKIWDQSTYQSITTITSDFFIINSPHSISKTKDNTVLIGYDNIILIVDIQTCKINRIQLKSSGCVNCIIELRNGLILAGSREGEIICYDSSFNQILFESKLLNNEWIKFLIESEDNQLIIASYSNIYVYKEEI